MKILITESKLEELKQVFFKMWDKQGYAKYDRRTTKMFNVKHYIDNDPGLNKTGYYMNSERLVRLWVADWNKKHDISPLSILDEFGMRLYEGPNFKFYESTKPIKFTYKSGNDYLEFEIGELRFDGDTLTLYYLNFNLNNAIIDGVNVNDELRSVEDDDDDYWNELVEHYRESAIGLVYDYMTKNYVNKMGDVDIEVEYVDSLFSN